MTTRDSANSTVTASENNQNINMTESNVGSTMNTSEPLNMNTTEPRVAEAPDMNIAPTNTTASNTTSIEMASTQPEMNTITSTGTNTTTSIEGSCRPTGCYNTECSVKDIPATNCTYKRKYDCFKHSQCTSTLGICGWTHNSDFFNCFENAS